MSFQSKLTYLSATHNQSGSMKRYVSVLTLISGVLAASSSSAALLVFNDRSAWQAAAGGAGDLFENFDSKTIDEVYGMATPVTEGFITWSVDGGSDDSWRIDAPPATFGSIPSVNGSTYVTTLAFEINSGFGDTMATFSSVRALGFDYAGASYSSTNTNITLTTSNGDTVSVEALSSGNSFVGLLYTEGETFNSLRWDALSLDANGSGQIAMGVDNVEAFSVSAVPVPAAAWLFGTGLLGLISIAKRKKA